MDNNDAISIPDKGELHSLNREIGAAEDQYVYFLLATASAAMFVAAQRTSAVGFHKSQLLLALAVAFWIASFVFGCWNRHLDIRKATLSLSALLIGLMQPIIRLKVGPEKVAENPEQFEDAMEMVETLRKKLDSDSDVAHDVCRVLYRWQFRLLVAGGFFYLLWHLYDMSIRTK